MQITRTEPARIQLLTCGACRRWQGTISTNTDRQPLGRCARFGETRPAEMRPRCNICWEPRDLPHIRQPLQAEVL